MVGVGVPVWVAVGHGKGVLVGFERGMIDWQADIPDKKRIISPRLNTVNGREIGCIDSALLTGRLPGGEQSIVY
jgi:hypothetical protein